MEASIFSLELTPAASLYEYIRRLHLFRYHCYYLGVSWRKQQKYHTEAIIYIGSFEWRFGMVFFFLAALQEHIFGFYFYASYCLVYVACIDNTALILTGFG